MSLIVDEAPNIDIDNNTPISTDNSTNNIISTIDERLFIIMKEEMNTDEQQHFIESFKICY
jgi:hypothetical protein